MKRISAGLFLLFFVVLEFFAQTGSPYSFYGMGRLNTVGTGKNIAMGGAGVALRDFNLINPLNPAAYTAQDTNSFLVDIGVSEKSTIFSTANTSENAYDFNIENISMAFPIFRWWKASFGISPFSEVNYYLSELQNLNIDGKDYSVDYYYKGTGGINKIRFGSGFQLTNFLSIGVNADYLFGYNSYVYEISPDITYSANTYQEKYLSTGDFVFTFGAQFSHKFNDRWNINLGGTYSPEYTLKGESTDETLLRVKTEYGTVENIISSNSKTGNRYTMPESYRLGFVFENDPEINNPKNTFTLAFDYAFSAWKNTNTFLETPLTNSSTFSGGFEYVPQKKAFKGYWKRIRYRAGINYTDSYITINNNAVVDKSLSVGFGFPMKYSNTMFNVTYQRGVFGTSENGLVEENYNMFRFNITIYEFWFLKPKID